MVYKKLREDGSFVIDIGGAYEKGEPSYSLYQFRTLIKMVDEIGFKLAQPFYWHNWTKDNGGTIPPNMLQFPNSDSNSQYLRYCKKCGVKGHPARFPMALPEFFIKFLTDEGDLVVDIFEGSNTTGMTAQGLGRHWMSFELSQEYIAASVFRFAQNEDEARRMYDEILNGNDITI